MEKQTTTGRAIRQTIGGAQADAAAKRLLSEKIILAWIMKSCVDEYKNCDINDIAEKYIEGDTISLNTPLLPGDGGYSPVIRGDNTEDKPLGEGEVRFDIVFRATAPDDDGIIELIINVESQNAIDADNPLTKRAIYYCCRLISSQNPKDFQHSEYGKIKKVCSIWVCPRPRKEHENTITEYEITEKRRVGDAAEKRKNYDLLSITVLNLGKPEDANFTGILKLLGVLMSNKMDAAQKQAVLHDEYGIKMTEKMKQEANSMNAWLQNAYEDGRTEGFDLGRTEGFDLGRTQTTLDSIRNLTESLNITIEQAMDALKIPQEERARYLKILTQ